MANTSYSDQMLALLSPATRAAVLERAEQIGAREREHARLVAEREAVVTFAPSDPEMD